MGLKHDTIAVVTGASRGAGRGIALALGGTGATVYVTGRTRQEGDAALSGTVQATAEAVTAAGGRGIAVYCDHADDLQVEALFQRVSQEQGRLDILVNNATVRSPTRAPFGRNPWRWPVSLMWDCAVTTAPVGTRHHCCSPTAKVWW